MSKKKKAEEQEILKKMFEDDGSVKPSGSAEVPPEEERHSVKEKTKRRKDAPDTVRCPKCGYVLDDRSGCPRCGYHGYIPMSESQTKKIKYVLYPILLIAAIILVLYVKGAFGS